MEGYVVVVIAIGGERWSAISVSAERSTMPFWGVTLARIDRIARAR